MMTPNPNFMPKSPHISVALKKEHAGDVIISWNGKILGMGKNAILAIKKAKKQMPSIEEKEFLISRVPSKYVRI